MNKVKIQPRILSFKKFCIHLKLIHRLYFFITSNWENLPSCSYFQGRVREWNIYQSGLLCLNLHVLEKFELSIYGTYVFNDHCGRVSIQVSAGAALEL